MIYNELYNLQGIIYSEWLLFPSRVLTICIKLFLESRKSLSYVAQTFLTTGWCHYARPFIVLRIESSAIPIKYQLDRGFTAIVKWTSRR